MSAPYKNHAHKSGSLVSALPLALLIACGVTGCAAIMNSATSGLAGSLSSAILNQDDPETVRDGAPAYLLMLDSFAADAPGNAAMLGAAAELYAAYGIVFVEDADRARRLTSRARTYGRQALCVSNKQACTLWDLPFEEFSGKMAVFKKADAGSLFTLGLSWLAYIQAHRDDWSALAELPAAEAVLVRVRELDADFKPADVEHYLAIMNTLRPPALGGNFDKGQAHFENAIALSNGQDLGIKVDFARYYARTLYDQELHDRLLEEVLASDPVVEGRTLFNTIAQRQARALLDSGADYF